LEIHVNNTRFVPPIVIPMGLALVFLCYFSVTSAHFMFSGP